MLLPPPHLLPQLGTDAEQLLTWQPLWHRQDGEHATCASVWSHIEPQQPEGQPSQGLRGCETPYLSAMIKSFAQSCRTWILHQWLETVGEPVYLHQACRDHSRSHVQKTCLAHFKGAVPVFTTKRRNSEKKAINKPMGAGWGKEFHSFLDHSVERQIFSPFCLWLILSH